MLSTAESGSALDVRSSHQHLIFERFEEARKRLRLCVRKKEKVTRVERRYTTKGREEEGGVRYRERNVTQRNAFVSKW